MDETNHQDWLNKGPWYNTSIYSKLRGSRFEYFITQAITDKYNLMCSLVAHDKMQPDYEDYESSIGDSLITNDATPKALEALGATINFIDICLKLFLENYDARCVAYITAIKEMFMQIPQNVEIAPTTKEKSKNSGPILVVDGICAA